MFYVLHYHSESFLNLHNTIKYNNTFKPKYRYFRGMHIEKYPLSGQCRS